MKTIIASIFLLAAIPASAGTTIPELTNTQPVATTGSGWQLRAALYGWGTALDGDVTLRGNTVPVDAAFEDVFENLDFAFMGAVEIGNGKWSFLADLFYAELSISNARRNLEFNSELDQFIGNFLIAYNVIDHPDTRFDVYAGARVNSLDVGLEILTNRVGTFSGSDSKTWVDPVIGARFQQELPNCFFVRAVGDIGGFGVSSDITWQALAALGYHVSDSAALTLGYRGIGTDYEDGQFGYDVISHGLLLGFEYKF
jgi:opacity protein-like surface antigen